MALEGQVAVITGVGAVEGLGNSMAKVFAASGAKVVGADLRADRGPEIERVIRDAGGEFTFVTGDVRKTVDCERLIQTALERYGRIDVLVNNAMTNPSPMSPSHEVTEKDWDNCMETMPKGTFFCCRYAIPAMMEQGSGVIINIASGAGLGAWAAYRAYGAAKCAVLHMSAGLAKEYADYGIRVHGIIMGAIASDEFRTQWANSPKGRFAFEGGMTVG